MTPSSEERNAIDSFIHANVRNVLGFYGWEQTGRTTGKAYEQFCLNENSCVWVPLDSVPFDWSDDEYLVETFAESLDVSTFEAIYILSGRPPWSETIRAFRSAFIKKPN